MRCGYGFVIGLNGGFAGIHKERGQRALGLGCVLRGGITGEVSPPAVHISGPLRAQKLGQFQIGSGDKKHLHPFADGRGAQRSPAAVIDRITVQLSLVGQCGE